MIERPYMPVDLAMRNDPKVGALEEENPALVTIWIYLLCMIYEQGGFLPTNYKRLAYLLRFPTAEEVRHVVEDFGLFIVEDGKFYSRGALERIEKKEEVASQRREGGKRGGRPRKNEENQEETSEKPYGFENAETEKPYGFPNQSINKSINQEINQCAGAGAPMREDDDFLIEKFFFRNMRNPGKEVARCLENYKDEGIKNREAVAKKWTPQDAAPRFDDPRCLPWAKLLYAFVGTAADHHEAAECLRHIDAMDIDRGRNELKVRMRGKDWAEAVNASVQEYAPLREGFDKVTITKRTGT